MRDRPVSVKRLPVRVTSVLPSRGTHDDPGTPSSLRLHYPDPTRSLLPGSTWILCGNKKSGHPLQGPRK